MSSKAVRLDGDLVRDAEAEARLMHRSPPKQIEYWASIGRDLGRILDPEDLLKVSLGLASLQLESREAEPVAPEDVFGQLERLRESGELARRITGSKVVFEAGSQPGLLIRIQDGVREAGRFVNGKFVVEAGAR